MKRLRQLLHTLQARRIIRITLLVGAAMIIPAAPVLADQSITNYETFCTQQFECGTYDPNFCGNGTSNTSPSPNGGQTNNTPKWNSGLQPPYYLEEFAIETLKDVAAKKGVDQSKAVTQEHVYLMVAWFWTEGGDTENSSLFNPLNTIYKADPSLIAPGDSQHFPSYASFDAGVEALALTITGHYQTRIANALTDPSTTADQVAQAIVNYTGTPGNAAWGTEPGALAANIAQVRKNYASEASTILGTPAKEGSTGARVPASQLKYNTGGGGTAAGGTVTVGTCASGNSVANCSLTTGTVGTAPGSSQAAASTGSTLGNTIACLATQELLIWQPPGGKPNSPPGGPASYCGKYINGIGKSNGAPDGGCEEWCADFVSWLYNQAGYPLQSPNWRVPAVASIRAIGVHGGRFTWKGSNYTPKPGDIVIHENQGSDHVNVVVSVNGNTVTMIGGDQGQGPYGGLNSRSDVSYAHANGYFSGDISGYVVPTGN